MLDRVMNLRNDETRIGMYDKVLQIVSIDTDLDGLRQRLCTKPTIHGRKRVDLALDELVHLHAQH